MKEDVDIRWNNKTEPFYNSKELKKSETPSAGCYGNARGLGKLAAYMANKGSLGGKTLISEDAWLEMHDQPECKSEPYFNCRTLFTKGGLNLFDPKQLLPTLNDFEKGLYLLREGYYGWFGYGGSILQWNPDLNIGFAYLPANLSASDLCYYRGGKIQAKVT